MAQYIAMSHIKYLTLDLECSESPSRYSMSMLNRELLTRHSCVCLKIIEMLYCWYMALNCWIEMP